MLTLLITNEMDTLLLSETKVYETFSFQVRDNIPFTLLKPGNLPSISEALFIEINLRSKKWLMCCSYNPNKSLINKFAYDIGKVLDFFIGNYDNFLIVGNLNSEITESSMHEFCRGYDFHSLCHKFTYYKNPEKPSCIDPFLVNSP